MSLCLPSRRKQPPKVESWFVLRTINSSQFCETEIHTWRHCCETEKHIWHEIVEHMASILRQVDARRKSAIARVLRDGSTVIFPSLCRSYFPGERLIYYKESEQYKNVFLLPLLLLYIKFYESLPPPYNQPISSEQYKNIFRLLPMCMHS